MPMRTAMAARAAETEVLMPDRPLNPGSMHLQLRLYVAGDAPNSTLARNNLRQLLAGLDRAQYTLEVIDCLDEPLRALADGVLVTPTLMRVEPEPQRTIVGS